MTVMKTLLCSRRIVMTLAAFAAFGWSSVVPAATADAMRATHVALSASDARVGAELVARIAGQLAKNRSVRAHFRQTRTLAALSAPLVSTGTLVLSREHGVIWHTDTPYQVTYVIGDVSVTKIDASGHRSTTSASRGGMAQVSRMMRAILSGDLSALYSQFDVAADGTESRWRLLLTPNQPQLAQFVKALRMDGGAFLQTLEIDAANGDTTRVEFSGSKGMDALPPAELALFGAR
jgi:outer membrane lipoprotein-sorting protein